MQLDHSYAQLCDQLADPRFFHRQQPVPLQQPVGVHFNQALADELGMTAAEQADWVGLVSGQRLPAGADPLAMAYAGHQFGNWAGQLGDGRGLLLTQVIDRNGTRQDLHLKGSGETPYSRRGDGRAVLRSTVREYLAGHALYHLGVPTSRALGMISSSTPVQRETLESGAMLIRVSDCHVRFGHFEWLNYMAPEKLAEFTDAMIDQYAPEARQADEPVLAFFDLVVQRTARLVAHWQAVGFAHGVLNTDNVNITGTTLDFGPYGMMERFDPDWINNHSDYAGRYTYGQQPSVMGWNLAVLASNLLPLAGDRNSPRFKEWETALRNGLQQYETQLTAHYQQLMAARLGVPADSPETLELVNLLLGGLQRLRLDLTQSLRLLTDEPAALAEQFTQGDEQVRWQQFWQRYQLLRTAETEAVMHQSNPYYILRNHMAQTAIERAQAGDYQEIERLFTLLSQPYTWQPERHTAADLAPLPEHVRACAVSCSS